jgi:hypothetical protein
MRSAPILAGVALLMTGAAPALAQPYPDQSAADQAGSDYSAQQQDYERQQDQYRDAQHAYRERSEDYDARRDTYYARRDDYERQRERFLHERAEYDARYGPGAYHRYWRDRPEAYDERYGPGAWDRDFGRDDDEPDR